jgi:hypothetical protein
MRDGKSEDEITEMLAKHANADIIRITGNERSLKRYDLTANYQMSVQGYMRYWRKKHPELL